jgi:hypothetical protein
MNNNTITDALRYYDQYTDKFKNLRRKVRYIQRYSDKQQGLEGLHMIFYDADMKKLFISKVEILGKYYNNINTWVWGWSLPDVSKSLVRTIRNVFLYGTDIDINDNQVNTMLRYELITSRFRIDNDIQIEIHCAIASYLAKKPFVMAFRDMDVSKDGLTKVKNDDDIEKTNTTFYVFIMDIPEYIDTADDN